ncbi:class II fructose-bisphosphate aldolase [Plantibacter sp. Mn2098]|uniref:class II fructose-bisphosphate aldolase n=1 Tax=Plantibacter sp. Mn2098 TaxID=3395266 RepID=UPI003BDA3243
MTLVPTIGLVRGARAFHRGIGAFNVIHVESAEALVQAAEDAGRPVILQLSENCVRYHGSLEPIARAMLAIAESSSELVAVHLDHAEDEELARSAVDLGFGSVMFDGAALPYAENVAATRRVVAYAHRAGASVEAELGVIGGKDGAHAPGVRTDPGEAAAFSAETGVDALAVAVGSSHAMTERTASLDLGLIAAIAEAVAIPLVLHGSSGVPDETLQAAIRAGMTKINVSTHLNAAFTGAVRATLDEQPALVDSRRYVAAGRDAMAREAARLVGLLSPDLRSPDTDSLDIRTTDLPATEGSDAP